MRIKASRYPGGSKTHPGLGFAGFVANTCGQRGIIWYQDQIIDTGTIQASPAYKGAPASFLDMNQIYSNFNLVLEKGNAWLIPARNGMATGAAMPLLSCPNGSDTPIPVMIGSGVGSPGGTPQQLGCPGNLRTFDLKLKGSQGWFDIVAVIDTGTPALPCSDSVLQMLGMSRGGSGFKIQAMFEPNPTPMPLMCWPQGGSSGNWCPAYWISQAVRIILTSNYTILQSLSNNATISYSCSGGGKMMGDALQGKWMMGMGMQMPTKPGMPQMPMPMPPTMPPSQTMQMGCKQCCGGMGCKTCCPPTGFQAITQSNVQTGPGVFVNRQTCMNGNCTMDGGGFEGGILLAPRFPPGLIPDIQRGEPDWARRGNQTEGALPPCNIANSRGGCISTRY